jgi:hypothetical protein
MKRLAFFVCTFIACAGIERTAAAQQAPAAPPPTFASPAGKGIIGGALLGAEAVMLVEAAAETKPAWAYAVGGGLGAIGGGIGGFFAQDADPKVSLYLLVGGMALALPTTVAVLSAAAYEPVNYVEDRPPADEPVADPARTTPATETKPTGRRPVPQPRTAKVSREPVLPPALFGWNEGELTLSIPAVEVRQMYTRTEIALYGVKQQPEVEVPVVNVVF